MTVGMSETALTACGGALERRTAVSISRSSAVRLCPVRGGTGRSGAGLSNDVGQGLAACGGYHLGCSPQFVVHGSTVRAGLSERAGWPSVPASVMSRVIGRSRAPTPAVRGRHVVGVGVLTLQDNSTYPKSDVSLCRLRLGSASHGARPVRETRPPQDRPSSPTEDGRSLPPLCSEEIRPWLRRNLAVPVVASGPRWQWSRRPRCRLHQTFVGLRSVKPVQSHWLCAPVPAPRLGADADPAGCTRLSSGQEQFSAAREDETSRPRSRVRGRLRNSITRRVGARA